MSHNQLRFLSVVGGLTLAIALMAPSTVTAQQSGSAAKSRVMFVFDGSRSMWGQIDGRAKIEIAREAMANAALALPLEAEAGLFVYGHRRRPGDADACSDIEEVVPISPTAQSVPAIISRVSGVTPRGRTPLSDAVRRAATAMGFEEVASTVVLVTDGVESCEADPCALAAELERIGVDFTAHVIGFGLSREDGEQVACLARQTGGSFVLANDAQGLNDALGEVVASAPEPTPESEPRPEPAPAALPETLAVRVLALDSSTQGLRTSSQGNLRHDVPIVSIVGPDGVELPVIGVGLADADLLDAWSIDVNSSWATYFKPKMAGEHVMRLAFAGFTDEVAFTVAPGMARYIDVSPKLTLARVQLLRTSGAVVQQGLTNTAFCPPTRRGWKDDATGCFQRGAATLIRPGKYALFTWRSYEGSTNASAVVDIGPTNAEQSLSLTVGQQITDQPAAPEPKPEQKSKGEGVDGTAQQKADNSSGGVSGAAAYDAETVTIDIRDPNVDLTPIYPDGLSLPSFEVAREAEPLDPEFRSDFAYLQPRFGKPANVMILRKPGVDPNHRNAEQMRIYFDPAARNPYTARGVAELKELCIAFPESSSCDEFSTGYGIFQVTRQISPVQYEAVIRFPEGTLAGKQIWLEVDVKNKLTKVWPLDSDGRLIVPLYTADTYESGSGTIPVVQGGGNDNSAPASLGTNFNDQITPHENFIEGRLVEFKQSDGKTVLELLAPKGKTPHGYVRIPASVCELQVVPPICQAAGQVGYAEFKDAGGGWVNLELRWPGRLWEGSFQIGPGDEPGSQIADGFVLDKAADQPDPNASSELFVGYELAPAPGSTMPLDQFMARP